MRFNIANCNLMRVTRKPLLHSYLLIGQVLTEVTDTNYLGVTINKANAMLSFLRRILKGCPGELRELAFFSLVRYFVEYSTTVWDPCQKSTWTKYKWYSYIFVKGQYKRFASVTSMLEELGWPFLSKSDVCGPNSLCRWQVQVSVYTCTSKVHPVLGFIAPY